MLIASIAMTTLTAQSGSSRAASARNEKPYTTWKAYGGGAHSSQYTALDQITRKNVGQLEVAWSYPVTGTIMFNPVVVDNVMYVQGAGNAIVALDAATGKELWKHPNQGAIGARGMNYWESADRSDRRLLYLNAGNLTAISAQTGETITSFGTNGRVDLRVALWRDARNPLQTSNPGRIFENLIIMSLPAQGAGYDATPADVQAYDVRTGKIAWVFHSIPHPGEVGYDTWPDGHYKKAGGVHNWSELTIDEKNGIAFIPFGTGRFDFYGGDRKGQNLFANSLVALDARTGKRIWHQQLVHHDLWDYDLPQAPKLLTLRQNGRSVDVVAQATKFGFIFVFDRLTGKPIFPIEERAVPQSDVPGEASWPTQPFPTNPPPYARLAFGVDDVNPYVDAPEQERLRGILKSARNEGLFTPQTLTRDQISIPGELGGSNWAGAAADPTTGMLYVRTADQPAIHRLRQVGADGIPANTPGQPAQRRIPLPVVQGLDRYAGPLGSMFRTENGLPAISPPWAEIVAYDLNEGSIKWRAPLGSVRALAAKGIIKTGNAHRIHRNGPVVTAGGLLFIGSNADGYVRAFDKDTGAVLWERALDANPEGMAAVFELGGREYVVFCASHYPDPDPKNIAIFPGRLEAQGYYVFALPPTPSSQQ